MVCLASFCSLPWRQSLCTRSTCSFIRRVSSWSLSCHRATTGSQAAMAKWMSCSWWTHCSHWRSSSSSSKSSSSSCLLDICFPILLSSTLSVPDCTPWAQGGPWSVVRVRSSTGSVKCGSGVSSTCGCLIDSAMLMGVLPISACGIFYPISLPGMCLDTLSSRSSLLLQPAISGMHFRWASLVTYILPVTSSTMNTFSP